MRGRRQRAADRPRFPVNLGSGSLTKNQCNCRRPTTPTLAVSNGWRASTVATAVLNAVGCKHPEEFQSGKQTPGIGWSILPVKTLLHARQRERQTHGSITLPQLNGRTRAEPVLSQSNDRVGVPTCLSTRQGIAYTITGEPNLSSVRVTVHRGLSRFSRRVGRNLGKVLNRRDNGTVPLAPREGDRSMFSANSR